MAEVPNVHIAGGSLLLVAQFEFARDTNQAAENFIHIIEITSAQRKRASVVRWILESHDNVRQLSPTVPHAADTLLSPVPILRPDALRKSA